MKIAIIGFQGDIAEHFYATQKAMKELNINGQIIFAKTILDLDNIDGIIIPGGETTTILRYLKNTGIDKKIKELAKTIPILATCAGMAIISSGRDKHAGNLLGLIDMQVERNAFGSQKNSFESKIKVKGIGILNAVFIRAPAITKINDSDGEILAKLENHIVAVKKNKIIALSFHPELTSNLTIHKFFLKMANNK